LVDLLVLGNDHHHEDAEQQGQDLHKRLEEGGLLQQLWQHAHRRDIDESTRGERECDGGRGVRDAPQGQRQHTTCKCAHSCEKLEEDRLILWYSGLNENGKVPNFVRHLVQQNCERGSQPKGLPGQEAGPDGQTVGEVVETVRSQIQVSGYLYFFGNSLFCLLGDLFLCLLFLLVFFLLGLFRFFFSVRVLVLFLLLLFILVGNLFGLRRSTVRMTMTSLHNPDKLLDTEEGQNAA